jgi:hypothetical protein
MFKNDMNCFVASAYDIIHRALFVSSAMVCGLVAEKRNTDCV